MKKGKIVMALSGTVLALAVSVSSAYAYYQVSSSQAIAASVSISDSDDIVKEVASFSDLFINSQDGIYNNSSKVSSVRKVLKLTKDITLSTDLVVTADVHLDLNGKTINLNDHVLTFKHGYDGVFSIYNGTIEKGTDGNGYISIDMVNASVVTNDLSYTSNGASSSSNECIKVVNMDSKYTAYSALYLASNAILSDINGRVSFKGFTEVSDATFDITTADKYIPLKECSYASKNECCSFVYKDLDLPAYYLSSDIAISYSVNDNDYLTAEGDLLKTPDTEADVTLTASVSIDGNSYSVAFPLHIVNLSNATVKTAVGNQLIKSYLSGLYVGESLTINGVEVLKDYYYEFNYGQQLPLTALDGNITYSYNTYGADGTTVVTTDSAANNGSYDFVPNSSCYYLGVTVGDSETKLQMYSVYVGTLESAARMIINGVYGGSIIYDKTKDAISLTTFDEMKELDTVKDYITDYEVTGVTYTVKAESDATTYYSIDDDDLMLAEEHKDDAPAKAGYVTATFTFKDGSSVGIDLYVNCYEQSGDTLSSFLPYYSEFNAQVPNELSSSFEMPFSYEGSTPYVCYDVAIATELESSEVGGEAFNYYKDWTYSMPDSLSVSLYYDGAKQLTFTNYTSQISFTSQLETFMTSKSLTLTDLAAKSDIKYVFEINSQKASKENTSMVLIYNYKFNVKDEWSQYQYNVTNEETSKTTSYLTEGVVSAFEVKGGLFYNASSSEENAIKDNYFFIWIYNNFNPDGKTISEADSTTLILTDWLGQDVAMDASTDSTLGNVSDFTGITNLTTVSTINLSGKTVSTTLLSEIAEMTSVTSLNLSGCSIEDISDLSSMTSLKELDISNNSIKYFSDIAGLTSLETVYLYNNNADNAYYGSKGICNSQAYVDMMRNGTVVYNNTASGVPIPYADSDDLDDYKRLSSIIYQNELSTKVSIKKLYDGVFTSLTATSFDLDNTGGSFAWNYGGGTNEYDATYFYVNYVFDDYTLTVKYYVERY